MKIIEISDINRSYYFKKEMLELGEKKKTTATEIWKHCWICSKVEWRKVSITALEDLSTGSTQPEQDGGNRVEKKIKGMAPYSGSFRTITKVPKFHMIQSQKKRLPLKKYTKK